jgi:transcriptional regulator with XRE-family HTH domain
MATSERSNDRAERLTDEGLIAIGRELRRARVGSGLSQRTLEAATGISKSEIGRIERGRAPMVPLRVVIRQATALGLTIPLKLYPGGDPLRDMGQARLLERFRQRLHPSLRWDTEVPLPIPGDRRAWDAVCGREAWRVGVEAETVLDDSQAVDRRVSLKRRDGGVDHVVILIADTPRNRRALEQTAAGFSGFPLRTREIMAALGAGLEPRGSGVVIL